MAHPHRTYPVLSQAGDCRQRANPRCIHIGAPTLWRIWRICWSWSTWLDVIAVLRESATAYNQDQADLIQTRLDETPADVIEPCLSLSDDVVLRSVNVAAWRLGLRLPDRGG
jgi:hypothetical protein